ncbi:tRNA-specific adenosine deaminase subunit Tad3p [[Candida] anglica]|uniref:tRNA-specific adenosine deaminase subunit Tad3p n=1 Tax=[Candida] anglica TaxID=148631 RepID=A0ABP0EEV4_9ASCO
MARVMSLFRSFVADVQTSVAIIRRKDTMVKHKSDQTVPAHVDLATGTLHGVLRQVRHASKVVSRECERETVWCCDLPPRETKSLLLFIREYVTPYDEFGMGHLKRFRPKQGRETPIQNSPEPKSSAGATIKAPASLEALVCSQKYIPTLADLQALLQQHTTTSDASLCHLNFYPQQVPVGLPDTKELAQEWSAKYWPVSWKGNPNHQFLKTARFNVGHEQKIVDRLVSLYREHQRPVTIIAREEGATNTSGPHTILAEAVDRSEEHPLSHATMEAIAQVADAERGRRSADSPESNDNPETNAYLCHDLLVYTTHEPCTMCCMGLVHSRIRRVVFMKEMPKHGALASNHQLGDMDGLNWKYDTWQWIRKEDIDALDSVKVIDGDQEV